ncbi:Retrovirus-related Pol polyprotein from transposon 17.6 [Schistosoma japonicum]|nr:Retrovirus-related Pol polyprotein from transposon 17.6 [Schistosoma japonicum]
MMMALGDDMVRRATAAGFCKSNSILDNWAILDEQFMDRQQRQDEPATDYLHELRYLASRALPSMSVAIREEMICARFSQGLQDRDLQLQLLRFTVQRVSEALTVAQRFEDAAKSTTNPILFTIHDRQRPVSRGRSDSFHAAEPPNSSSHDFAPVTVLGRIEGMEKMMLIDTGASKSVVRRSFVSNIKVPLEPASRRHHLITADGSVIQAQFSTILTLQFGGFLCKQRFLVCDYITWDIILGVDFLRKNRALVDFSTSCVLVGRHVVPIATTVKSKCIGTVDASNQPSVIEKVSIGSHLDRQTRERVVSVLMEFREVFEENGLPGRTRAVWHEIDTGDHKPIKQYPRRVPIHYQPELDKVIKEMLKQKVIKPSTSPWASPIVLVKKKDNSLRLCVDYRRLNAITKRDSFSLPRIDATLDVLGEAQWFSTLDLASGYWQVEIRPKDRQKTAFVIPTGLYEFQTMPFGLTNAPATFQRLMQTVLDGLVPKRCLIYLDDIIVHGRAIEQHMENLRIVLDCIRANGLKLRPNKCQFLKQSVTFLGHYITSRGVQTDCSKVQAVQSWPTPTSAAKVKNFMGLASYYRRVVANFAGIATPLHRLTEKGRKFLWTAECQSAFEELKAKLAAASILGFPDTSPGAGSFILDTDASDHAIGALLSQISPGGQEKVISYGSRKLDKREVNYSSTRRELLALVYFMKHFRHYLLGRQFRVRTDHQALQWLNNFREADGQLARWQETLQEFDYVCEYRGGAQHLNADAMSRHPAPVEVVNNLLTANSEVDWGSLQAADPDLALVYARQQHGNNKPTSQEMKDMTTVARCICVKWGLLRLCNDVLYLTGPSKPPRLIVPRAKTSHVITRHAGTRKTEAAIRARFWWPLIHRDVEESCKSCDTCARVKSPSKYSRAKLIPMVTTAPYQREGVDDFAAWESLYTSYG